MSTTISPNMNLVIPTVGTEAGPQYAQDVNDSLTLIDQHDHSSGSGVPITPSGISINTALSFGGNLATNLAGLTLTAQNSTPGNNTVYESGVDLYYVDGNGNNVRITQSGGVAGSPGSISNLASPASASYVSGSQTFVWQSGASIAANMDAGSLLLRNLSPNSTYALTLSPPSALAANYSLTLPSLPASQKIMTLDSSGNMAAPYVIDNSSLEISSNTIQIKDSGVTTAKINALAVTRPKLVAVGQVTTGKQSSGGVSSASYTLLSDFQVTLTTTGRPVMLMIQGSEPGQAAGATGAVNIEGPTITGGYSVRLAISSDSGSTFLAQWLMRGAVTSGASVSVPSSFMALAPMAAGTYTFKVYMALLVNPGGTLTLKESSLIAYEL